MRSTKGQWFILSAVAVSFIFLSLSTFFREYYNIDTSAAVFYDEDFVVLNIISELNKTLTRYYTSDSELEKNLKTLIEAAENGFGKLGYFVDITILSPIQPTNTKFLIEVKTHRMAIRRIVTLP